MERLYNVPCCGGFCAPTKNPDTTCYRHVSNEYTLAGAPKFIKVAPYVETCACCRKFGGTGLPWCGVRRRTIQTSMAVLNGIQMILYIIAACGMTKSTSLIESTSWVSGEVTFARSGNNIFMGTPINMYVGINMVVFRADCGEAGNSTECKAWFGRSGSGYTEEEYVYKRDVSWDDADACKQYDTEAPSSIDSKQMSESCEDCNDALFSNFALVMGIGTQIPTITTNLQRSTPFGDVNCQASLGVITNIFGFFSNLVSLLVFAQACYINLPNSMGNNNATSWSLGYPYWCLVVGTVMKLPDAICHLLLPTPEKRWDAPIEKLTSLEEYMSLSNVKQQVMDTDGTVASSVGKTTVN